MLALVEHEFGAGAASRPAPGGPLLVGHVLAGNVPALGLPAIALGCLVGAAVVVKSGRDDPLSAPAFHRALAAVDPALAATVVTAYWPGGERAWEEAAFARADVVVASGTDETVAALAGRLGARLLAHGERVSVAAVSREGLGRDEPLAERLALGVPPDRGPARDPAPSPGHARRAARDAPARPGRVRRAGGVGSRDGGAGAGTARARRRPHLPHRPHAAADARLAPQPAAAARLAPRPPGPERARGRGVSEDDLHALFLRHVCQTSPAPLGITVARAS